MPTPRPTDRPPRPMPPLVTVVMPTYDQDAFLPAAVDSLLGQTLDDWELVVVDAGWPGDTKSALGAAIRDVRVHLEVVASNGGLGAALNRGLALARGALVAYAPERWTERSEHTPTTSTRRRSSTWPPACRSGRPASPMSWPATRPWSRCATTPRAWPPSWLRRPAPPPDEVPLEYPEFAAGRDNAVA